MIKLVVLYGHPDDPQAFETYYQTTHLPIAKKMNGIAKIELTKFLAAPDGSKPAYYRMTEIYFNDQATMTSSLSSSESKATAADLKNFASGGVTISVGQLT